MTARVWFLCRSASPISNSGEVIDLAWTTRSLEEIRAMEREIYVPERENESSIPPEQPYQVLHVFSEAQGHFIEAMREFALAQGHYEPMATLKYMLTHALMRYLREGVGEANEKLREYQRKRFKEVSGFLGKPREEQRSA